MKAPNTKVPYVYRVTYKEDRVDGYLAKVFRSTAKLHKIFQLADYAGDHEKCIKAAATEVAAFTKVHPRMSRQELAEIPRDKKDKDLPVGVIRTEKKVKGKWYAAIIAEWSPSPGHQKKKSFSVNKYGEDEAIDLAIETRRGGVKQMVTID